MTPEQRELCWMLLIRPPRGTRQISKEEFASRFPSALQDGKLAAELLHAATATQNAEDLQCTLLVGFTFGFTPEHRDILVYLANADWHHSHEDIVEALEEWPVAETVEALFQATLWIPKYLDFDDSRALAVKAIWAIGKVPGPLAEEKLAELARSSDPILQANANKQLGRRRTEFGF
jgi:hypothetical protein